MRQPRERGKDRYWLHLLLFAVTLGTTTWMGGQLVGRYLAHEALGTWWFVPEGLRFAGSLLLFLTVHEFGHYFAARHHRIDTSLPYYIPVPFAIGTMGAVIRIREPIPTTRKLFDVGAAGPLAGFVVALGVLVYGLATLETPEAFAATISDAGHEQLKAFIAANGRFPSEMLDDPTQGGGIAIVVGQTPLFWALTQLFPHVPPMYEIIHYPVLLAGWFGLFFTALNLLPVGQLDGGHILYALVGRRWHRVLARGFVVILLMSGALGFRTDLVPWLYAQAPWLGAMSWFILAAVLYFFLNRVFDGRHRLIAPVLLGLVLVAVVAETALPALMQLGHSGWLVWCLLIVYLIKIEHPPVLRPEKLTPRRRALGIVSIIIFVLCFSLTPLTIV